MKERNLITILLLALLLLSSIQGTAQPIYQRQIDSIRHEIPKLKGKDLVDAYYKIYNICYYAGDVKQERSSITDLLEAAERQRDMKKQGTARVALLYYYYNNDLIDSLLSEFPKQHQFLLKHQDWKLYYDSWVLIANHYTFTGHSNTALRELKRMYEDAQSRKNNYGIGLASYGMGNAYMDIGFHEEAIQSYERCIKALQKTEFGNSTLLDVYPYYCSVLSEVKNYKRMLEITDLWRAYLDSHKKELGLDSEKGSNTSYYTYYYNSRATALMGLGNLTEAEELLTKAYETTKDLKDNSQLTVFYNLGQLYMKKGDYEKALNFNNQIIGRYTVQEDPSGVLMLKKQRAEIMLQSRHFEEAAGLYKQVFYLSDSLNIKSVKNQLNEFNTLFKVDELEKSKQEEHTRHVYIVLGVIIGAMIVVGVVGLYFLKRLHEKNRELAVALDHAQESDRMKTAFVQHVSHEIRTPLNVITGFAQVIGNPSFKLSTELRENIVNSIESNTREITNFVNELLEFSENEGHSRYSLTDDIRVNEFCDDLLTSSMMENNGKLELVYEPQVDDTLIVKSNTLALQRILRQLIGNGIKFTEKGSVRLGAALSADSSQLMFSVTDTGIGILEEDQDRIFEKFYKVDSFKKGLGLGLPMAYRIAKMIGGDLQLDKSYQGGTRFVLTIPANNNPS